MRITTLALLGLGLSLVACRGGDGDDDSGGTPDARPMIDSPPADVRIQDIQSDAMAPGTVVSVKGVVVTAIDAFGSRAGDLFVQEPEGGERSGVKIFGAPLDQVAMLQVGDLVDIAGAAKEEFALSSDTSGRKVTELKPAGGGMTIKKVGTGTVPAPAIVDAVALSMMDKAAREAEWEKWEGVLITVINARQIAAQRSFGQGPDQVEFRITGVARVQSVLAPLPATNAFGVCYERITGIGDYFFNDLVLPRSTDDLVPGGTGCRPMATSIVAAQSTPNTEVVDLRDLVVTGRDDIGATSKGFWVADALEAAPYNGIFVFTREVSAPAEYVPGAVVSVRGAVTEFDLGSGGNPPTGDTLTQIAEPIHALVSAPMGVPVPVKVTADVVSDIGESGEPYESVLVQVENVKVTNTNAGGGKVELTDNSGNKLIMDDDAFVWPEQVLNTCYATVTGIMSVQVIDNVRTINPRALTDFVVGTGCN
jgi:hypothetical protein